MGMILVQYKTEKLQIKRWRMWYTVVDKWVSKPMNREEAIDWLINDWSEPHSRKKAIERVDRIGYPKRDLDWLNEHFDSCVKQLSRIHREG